MTGTTSIDAARLELMLTELRLPGMKTAWARLAAQADKSERLSRKINVRS
jgi:hypothetical protein